MELDVNQPQTQPLEVELKLITQHDALSVFQEKILPQFSGTVERVSASSMYSKNEIMKCLASVREDLPGIT